MRAATGLQRHHAPGLGREELDQLGPADILAEHDAPRRVRAMLKNGVNISVLSYQELAADFPVQPIGPVGLGRAEALQRAAA